MPDGSLPLRFGPGGARLLRAWRRMVRAGRDAGMRFVVDEVLLTPQDLPDWYDALAGLDVFFVGVHCDLAELQRREIERGDRGVGQAISQYDTVHSYGSYDFEVDTTATSTADCVDAILVKLDLLAAAPS
jgi:chloramphenicol 3-O phosphotransferase